MGCFWFKKKITVVTEPLIPVPVSVIYVDKEQEIIYHGDF
jgi:hypothetical protein